METISLPALPVNHNNGVATGFPGTSWPVSATIAEKEEPHHLTEASQADLGRTLTSRYSSGSFLPLSDKDAAQLPELNFRPLALKVGYLVPVAIWYLLCFSGVTFLAVFGRIQPSWFHLESHYSYDLWLYVPGIIGFLTTVLWRGTLQSFNRVIPYVRMANLPLSRSSRDKNLDVTRPFLNEPLTGVPGGEVHLGVLLALWINGDYLSFVVNLSPVFTFLLTPIKSGIFQLVLDDSGWGIRVSVAFCIVGMVIYLWLFLVTLAITLHLRKNRTGLKWNPSTLATQLSLIQGSNVFDKFADIPMEKWAPLNLTIRRWPQEGLILRLGYWREQETNLIIHGVRFLPKTEPLQIDLESDTKCATKSENVRDRSVRVEMAAITIDADQRNGESTSPIQPNRDGGRLAGSRASGQFTEPATNVRRATPSVRHESISARPRQRNPRPDVDRVWNLFLQDSYLIIITLVGIAVLIAATVAWAKGDIHRPFHFSPPTIVYPGSGGRLTSIIPTFIRGIVFTLLPSLLFGIFNNTFLSADIYQRSMIPIHNMASPLPEDDRKRLCLEEEDIKGATARDSMLLDYISPDLASCIVAAAGAGHYKIILGTILATLCNSVYLVVGRVFAFGEGEASGYTVNIQLRNFYAAFSIMIIYCISIWILRPRGVTRTCRRIFTLMDFVSLVHKSHILQCPEFWLQAGSDTEEHMKSQVTLANRLYRFGVYTGMDEQEYVGISIHEVPRAWILSSDAIPYLHYSVELAKDVLRFGLYDDLSLSFAQNFLASGPRTRLNLRKVYSNDYRSWSWRAKKLAGLTGKADVEAGLNDHPGNNTNHDVAEGRSSSYQSP
ncbi:MAG: hypothetical protein M1839_000410 [Geoglossum umbratile]|nr:MAG: hypothetical protein M1839_000410 [Geoglossum umbratile]